MMNRSVIGLVVFGGGVAVTVWLAHLPATHEDAATQPVSGDAFRSIELELAVAKARRDEVKRRLEQLP
jgi:hypothetical protein